MKPIDCGDCNPFVERVLHYYRPLIERYPLEFSTCTADRGGRECQLLYTGSRFNLLFVLTDGAEGTGIASRTTSLPENGWSGLDGEGDWYSVVALIAFLTRKRVLTDKLSRQFTGGERDYLEWESPLTDEWIDRLIPLFAPDNPGTWRTDFANYVGADTPR